MEFLAFYTIKNAYTGLSNNQIKNLTVEHRVILLYLITIFIKRLECITM